MDYHDVSEEQKLALGRALLMPRRNEATPPVAEWITEDLREVRDESYRDVKIVPDYGIETYYANLDGGTVSWTPDCLFTAWARKGFGPLQSPTEHRIDYPIEIRTGENPELDQGTREVMRYVMMEDDTVPVIATVDLDGLTIEYGISFRRAQTKEENSG